MIGMRKYWLLVFYFFGALSCMHAQHRMSARNVTAKELPKQLIYQAKFKQALQWNQHDTAHYVILTETDLESPEGRRGPRSAFIHAYHYILHGNFSQKLWEIKDGTENCEVDFHAYFLPHTFSVTDIDNDSIPEIWVMYSVACRGDISPGELKIIMYEGKQKHAMRGRMLINYSASERDGGEYTFDAPFNRSPAAIRDYAKKLWKKYREEKW